MVGLAIDRDGRQLVAVGQDKRIMVYNMSRADPVQYVRGIPGFRRASTGVGVGVDVDAGVGAGSGEGFQRGPMVRGLH